MNDTTRARAARRDHGRRRVFTLTTWVAAGAAALATTFGVVFGLSAASASATTDNGTATVSPDQSTETGDNGLNAPQQVPQEGSGSAHTGSGGS
jgi:hypothetical protein